jgi:two-component system, chemotaxis family, protein-glutamate methylesterase/glutaminase
LVRHKAKIVVIGGSAGGVEALTQVVAGLGPDFPAALFVTIHLPARSISRLPEILTNHGPLPASHPMNGGPIQNGHIYVAPPDHHLLVHQDHITLSTGPKENRQRPAVNALFRSAAIAYGPGVIGVILTGALDDGSAGLWEIKQRGGKTIVQDPRDALFPDMPRNALEQVPIDYVRPVQGLASLLNDLVGQPVLSQDDRGESMTKDFIRTDLTCPECRGPISECRQGSITEFRCRVGHRYSPETFLATHADTRERALCAAVVALEEGADVARELATNAASDVQRRLEQEAGNNASAAAKIRELLAVLTQEQSSHLIKEVQDQTLKANVKDD